MLVDLKQQTHVMTSKAALQSSYTRVEIPQVDLGRKLGYTEMLDVISYFHLAQKANQTDPKEALDVSPKASATDLGSQFTLNARPQLKVVW